MKKVFILGLMSLLILLLANNVFGSNMDNSAVGIGLGIPYGGIGFNFEQSYTDFFSVIGGIGFGYDAVKDSWEPISYDVGGRVYLASLKSIIRPYLGGYYGNYGAYGTTPNTEEKITWTTINSRSYGIELLFKDFSLDLEEVDIFDNTSTKTYALGIKSWFQSKN
jgi:hypothetical protein